MAPCPIRIGVIGLGLAGEHLHLPALRRLGEAAIVKVADSDETKHSVAGSLPFTTDWRDLLEAGLQAVVVATPPEAHAEMTKSLILAGIHVYVEKPLATSSDEAAALIHLARRSGLVLNFGYAFRFHPLWQKVASLVGRGGFSSQFSAAGRFSGPRQAEGWRSTIVDVGCHHVDLISWLIHHPPKTVQADLAGNLDVQWPNGTTLSGRYAVEPPIDRVELLDGQATITIDRLKGVRLRSSGVRLGRLGLPDPGLVRSRVTSKGWERSYEAALRAFLRDVVGTSEVEDSPASTALDALSMVATGEAILRSLASGKSENVALTTGI